MKSADLVTKRGTGYFGAEDLAVMHVFARGFEQSNGARHIHFLIQDWIFQTRPYASARREMNHLIKLRRRKNIFNSARVSQVAAMLNKAEIPTEIIPDPMNWIWGKFVLNCGVNALTAITGLRSGEIYRTPEVSALQDRVIDEILAVVDRKQLKLPESDPRKKIKDHCRIRYNKPSMMQHIEQGRRTEIDALNGALVREARALGIATPYNEAVVAIVKGLEKSRRQTLHEPPRDYKELEQDAQREAAKG